MYRLRLDMAEYIYSAFAAEEEGNTNKCTPRMRGKTNVKVMKQAFFYFISVYSLMLKSYRVEMVNCLYTSFQADQVTCAES